ncbi:hypothetical protein LTR84_008142 [Exophiala bonariae]|uniref:NADH:flavin oxidoreductase/NADH oxidase N-terminal domain-containing protein n=1 Tax=Exophiala bonariae TaxID=1690606 RepID=A0AAV9NMW3_9EURO|nr:hypothetical protein LTR84_008142 [Exophiala bonariae]
MEPTTLQKQANARGSAGGFSDAALDVSPIPGIERENAKIFTPLRIGDLRLQHRVFHPAMGRSRSINGAESPLAKEYFSQRTTAGSLMISQATGITADSVAWPWAASLHNSAQQAALVPIIKAVHENGGYWFQQLFHVGRCTTPALVKRARNQAGLYNPPPYGYRPVSSSNVPESAINTHSGESSGAPHDLSIQEIHDLTNHFKSAAKRAVNAGADGIEILAGNGWLIDQFLHDNINKRNDDYGGSIENRSRFALEVVEAVAEAVGYQRIGIRLSPFSFFHETDGSQPLEQVLHLSAELVRRGIAYLHVGQGKFTRGLSLSQNVQRLVSKGIAAEDISLRPFRQLLDTTRPIDPLHSPAALIGNGGYNGTSAILAVEEGLADGISFGRRFISNPDLVKRLQLGKLLTPNNTSTFYSHGAEGFISYDPHDNKHDGSSETSLTSDDISSDTPPSAPLVEHGNRSVAIIGAGVSGIASAAAFSRVVGFDLHIFERQSASGGVWLYDTHRDSVPVLLTENSTVDGTTPRSLSGELPVTEPYSSPQIQIPAAALNPKIRVNFPYNVLSQGSMFETSLLQEPENLSLTCKDISGAVARKAKDFEHLIQYQTTVENVERLDNDRLRLRFRKKNPDNTDTWSVQDFDHLIVATGHHSGPLAPHFYPFLSEVRPPSVSGYRVPALYQHIFDMHNPATIAFNGVPSGPIPWLTWEKSAFLIALLWSGKIKLPSREDQEAWETRRVAQTGDRKFHALEEIVDQVLYFDELNELAEDYLFTDNRDDLLLRSFPFSLVLEIINSKKFHAESYSGVTS